MVENKAQHAEKYILQQITFTKISRDSFHTFVTTYNMQYSNKHKNTEARKAY